MYAWRVHVLMQREVRGLLAAIKQAQLKWGKFYTLSSCTAATLAGSRPNISQGLVPIDETYVVDKRWPTGIEALLHCEVFGRAAYLGLASMARCPTDPFTVLGPCDQDFSELYAVQERDTTDFEAPKLWKGRSGGCRLTEGSFAFCCQGDLLFFRSPFYSFHSFFSTSLPLLFPLPDRTIHTLNPLVNKCHGLWKPRSVLLFCSLIVKSSVGYPFSSISENDPVSQGNVSFLLNNAIYCYTRANKITPTTWVGHDIYGYFSAWQVNLDPLTHLRNKSRTLAAQHDNSSLLFFLAHIMLMKCPPLCRHGN